MKYEIFIALRHLKGKNRSSAVSQLTILSIVGVAVGVWALVVVMSVLNGFGQDLRKKILQNTPQLIVEHRSGRLRLHRQYCQKLRGELPQLTHCSPYIFVESMLLSKINSAGVLLRGLAPDSPMLSHLQEQLRQGKISDLFVKKFPKKKKKILQKSSAVDGVGAGRRYPTVFLGKELAQNLGVKVGELIQAVSPLGSTLTPFGPTPRIKKFYVAGIVFTGMYEYDSKLAFVSLKSAQKLFKMRGEVTGLELAVKNFEEAPEIKVQIRNILGDPHLRIKDWSDINSRLFSALRLERIMMFAVLSLILLVASFSIVSTLTMSIIERTSEIAILKAMGAKKLDLMKTFMLEGMAIGSIGTAVGLFFGWRTCQFLINHPLQMNTDVYYIPQLPVQIAWGDFLFAGLAAIFISIFAAIYPALQAAELHPLEGLQRD